MSHEKQDRTGSELDSDPDQIRIEKSGSGLDRIQIRRIIRIRRTEPDMIRNSRTG
jgi:hypothetical protein